jgi:hypothetical protein
VSELTPLSEIMRNLFTPEGLAQAREEERAFRRGYHQGFDAAADAIRKLLLDDDMPAQDAYALIALHTNRLAVWRIEETERFIVPPTFDRSTLQETLDIRWKTSPEVDE